MAVMRSNKDRHDMFQHSMLEDLHSVFVVIHSMKIKVGACTTSQLYFFGSTKKVAKMLGDISKEGMYV